MHLPQINIKSVKGTKKRNRKSFFFHKIFLVDKNDKKSSDGSHLLKTKYVKRLFFVSELEEVLKIREINIVRHTNTQA